jgi:MFS family permease
MAMFTFDILLGPVVGPVSGSFLSAAKGWRWVFWIVAMAVILLLSHFPSLTKLLTLHLDRSRNNPLLHRLARILRPRPPRPQSLPSPRLHRQHIPASKSDNGLSPRDYFKRSIGRAIKILIYFSHRANPLYLYGPGVFLFLSPLRYSAFRF